MKISIIYYKRSLGEIIRYYTFYGNANAFNILSSSVYVFVRYIKNAGKRYYVRGAMSKYRFLVFLKQFSFDHS